MRKNRQKESSTNSISMARTRIIFDNKNGFRSSNVVFDSNMVPEEAEEYYMVPKESIDKMNGLHGSYNHDIDSSAAILKTQKI